MRHRRRRHLGICSQKVRKTRNVEIKSSQS